MIVKNYLLTKWWVAVLFLGLLAPAQAQVRIMSEEESQGRLELLAGIGFENLNPRQVRQPLRIGGVVFNRFAGLARVGGTGTSPVVMRMTPGNVITLTNRPRFVVLELLNTDQAFSLIITDGLGDQYTVPGIGREGHAWLGVESTYGVRRIEVESTTSGPIQLDTLYIHDVIPPSRLVARPLWSTQINLTWRNHPSGQESLSIERRVGDGSFTPIATLEPTVRSFQDTEVVANTRYTYRIRGTHPLGESAYSNEGSATTPHPQRRLVFTSIAAEDGTVCEEWEIADRGANILRSRRGDEALLAGDLRRDQQCKAILSFDTSALPQGVPIDSAILRLRRGSQSGSTRNLEPIVVDIRSGSFGDSAALEPGDFEAFADASGVAILRPRQGGAIYTARIPGSALSNLNRTGRTQFRISMSRTDNDNFSADFVGWFAGDTRGRQLRPTLEILLPTPTVPGPE